MLSIENSHVNSFALKIDLFYYMIILTVYIRLFIVCKAIIKNILKSYGNLKVFS